ncbi:MAG: hypothetical protein A2Z57_12075 [Planctomycetes bacterium RIFCSPHIGHO2_12_39_6]|nr:MAG: hypothetical protein A2Z57_12075 [Planctomycetes bacterium RIFCSPHIGHO2_12_39_6]
MAIIGKGDIASALTDQVDKIFFASGVSNSSCTDWHQYQREKDLLLKQSKFSHLVYFSTLSIYYTDTPYTRHKKIMEHLVKDNFAVSTIVRIGNITWGRNPNTLINFLKAKIENGEPREVQDVFRYIINKGEFLHWISLIPDWTTEMNLTGKQLKVSEIVKLILHDAI